MVNLYLFQVQFSESVPQTSHGEAVQERQLRAEEPHQNVSSGKEIWSGRYCFNKLSKKDNSELKGHA